MKLPGLGLLVSLGAAISLFSCGIATIVAASRIMYSIARQGGLPPVFGRVSGRHAVPKRAVAMSSAIILLFLLALTSFANPLDVYDWLGTFGTFRYVTAYALTCVAAPVFLRRSGQFRIRNGVLSIAALGILGYILFGSVYPVPPTPMHFIPWLFKGLLSASFGFSTWYEKRSVA